MFYSDVILSKRGPLAKVWLAAHAERRLSKAQLVHVDIEQSVSTIIGEDGVPMALRLSGQLLLGVVRIYSRQAKYLLDDCNEALLRLKTAFRSGALENTDLAPSTRQAVTLPVTRTAYDLSLPDPAFEGWEATSSGGGSEGRNSNRYTARPADITLQRFLHAQPGSSPSGWASGDFFDADNGLAALSPTLPALERRDSQGRLVDANGDLIDEADETFSSIGVGRDAQSHPAGRTSLLGGDLTGIDDFGVDDFLMADIGEASQGGGLDLGLDQFDEERQRSVTPARGSLSMLNQLTPQTKRKMQQAAEKRANMAKASRKAPRQIIDPHTELNEGIPSRRPRNADALVLRTNEYLPSSRSDLRLLELEKDPAKGLLPFARVDGSSDQIFAAALGLAPELRELFTFDPAILRRRRQNMSDEDSGPARKRIRAPGEDDEDEYGSEIGRRLDLGGQPDFSFGDDNTGGFQFDDFGADDDMTMPQLDLGDAGAEGIAQLKDLPTLRRSIRIQESDAPRIDEQQERRERAFHDLGDLGRLSTPSDRASMPRSDTDLSPTASYPLRAFDTQPAAASSLSEINGAVRNEGHLAITRTSATLGLSKNAIRAVHVLSQQLGPAPGDATRQQQQQRRTSRRSAANSSTEPALMSFQDVTRNASRRAAAGFFFELLALGTKDCIEVEQEESYGDIRVQAKAGLWTLQQAVQA